MIWDTMELVPALDEAFKIDIFDEDIEELRTFKGRRGVYRGEADA